MAPCPGRDSRPNTSWTRSGAPRSAASSWSSAAAPWPSAPTGTTFTGSDEFGTRNSFYGGQLGLEGEWQRDEFFVSAYTKVALGVSHERSSIAGSTTALLPGGASASATGGTLALPSNVGRL